MATDNNFPEVVTNISRSRNNWARVSRILGCEGLNSWTSGDFIKVVIQAVLLFGFDTWVVTPHVGRTLGGFRNSVDHQITGKQHQILPDGGWGYPPLWRSMRGRFFEGIVYIHNSETEHGCAVYCNVANYGDV